MCWKSVPDVSKGTGQHRAELGLPSSSQPRRLPATVQLSRQECRDPVASPAGPQLPLTAEPGEQAPTAPWAGVFSLPLSFQGAPVRASKGLALPCLIQTPAHSRQQCQVLPPQEHPHHTAPMLASR